MDAKTESLTINFSVNIASEPNESVFVVGNLPELGCWNPENAISLHKESFDKCIWIGKVQVPKNVPISYRYLTKVSLHSDSRTENILHRWENHDDPRKLENYSPMDKFGLKDEISSICHGLVTKQSVLVLKIKKDFIKFQEKAYDKSNMLLKIVAAENSSNFIYLLETAVINETSWQFNQQAENGTKFIPSQDYVIASIHSLNPSDAYNLKFTFHVNNEENNLKYIGACNIPYESVSNCQGSFNAVINSVDLSLVGKITVDYFWTCGVGDLELSLENSYSFKNNKYHFVGHRGSGASSGLRNLYPPVPENTIASFNLAHDIGLDLVEFDVLLSKDMVPVIYHDYCIGLSPFKDDAKKCQALEVNVMDMTLEQLQNFHIVDRVLSAEIPDGYKLKQLNLSGDQTAFPTLENVFKRVKPNLGFNIEIKFPNVHTDGSHEINRFWSDLNVFLDTILQVVFKHAGDRVIFFSCFNPDICTMLRLKQNIYPVLFLISGSSKRWLPFDDSRSWSLKSAMYGVLNAGLQGIVSHADEIFENSDDVKHLKLNDLLLYAWGEPANDKDNIEKFRFSGLNGVIHDWLGSS